MTRNCLLLVSMPPGVVTVTGPVVAPSGTVASRNVSDSIVKVAGVALNETLVVPVNPCPRIPTFCPTLCVGGTKRANRANPTLKL